MRSAILDLETPLGLRSADDIPSSVAPSFEQPRVSGKFLHVGADRFWVKGVTYGTFAPGRDGDQLPSLRRVAEDFAAMRASSINTVRTYTLPRREVLDCAAEHGLRVMVGLAWPQHLAFLDDAKLSAKIRRRIVADVRTTASHPAVLLVALGNEIPAPVVRWLGRARVERFLRDLYDEAKGAAPECLFTYVNYPPTEYLDLSFADVCAFNVYLHRHAELRAYLARLQNVAGAKPLLLAELGADSVREGEVGQAALLSMQLRAAFAEGACGAVAFAWTDEWWRGGGPVDDWAFGLVDAARRPKPALHWASEVFDSAPFPKELRRCWPRVSVVVCAYNEAATIGDCLESLVRLDYPDVEIIVVNDGSRDGTGDLARAVAGVRVIDIPNRGLSVARNVGLGVASGDIVAYTDADVRVDRDWLTYLVQPMLASDAVATGGPNVVPPDDPWMAQAVARAPGGPTHVLLDDRVAEHVPGCNMAFRRDALVAIGGFNPVFVRAGDDVDVCWRLQALGWTITYAPAALVWHRHRSSLRAYWRQQVGYGEGQVWLAPFHPDRFRGRRIGWRGHIYSPLPFVRALTRLRVNTGVWGTAAFPSVYRVGAPVLAALPHTVRWQATSVVLVVLGLILGLGGAGGWAWLVGAMGASGLLTTIVQCCRHAAATEVEGLPPVGGHSLGASRLIYWTVIAFLHLVQPCARATGQIRGLLRPPRPSRPAGPVPAMPTTAPDLGRAAWLLVRGAAERRFWSERWASGDDILRGLVDRLQAFPHRAPVEIEGGWRDDRDLRTEAGPLAWLDLRVLVEDHGAGRCLVRVGQRVRVRPLRTIAALVALAIVPIGAVGPWPFASDSSVLALSIGLAALAGMPVWPALRALSSACAAVRGLAADLHWQSLDADRWRGERTWAAAGALGWRARRLIRLARLLPVVGITLVPSMTAAQPAYEVRGTVSDATGGAIVGAQVEVVGERARCEVETDSRGRFRCRDLPSGRHELHVSSAGFNPVTQRLEFGSVRSTTVDIVLDVLITAEADVSAGGDSPPWARPLTERVFLGADLDELPAEPGQLLRRLRELAGATGRPGELAVYVDGFSQSLRLQPREAIQLIRVSADPFAAQFAEPGRMRIDIVTKPGESRYLGEATVAFNDSLLNGLNAFSPTRTPAQTRHYTGYFSGPIVPKWWSLVLYGGRWEHDTTAVVNATVLDPDFLTPTRFVTEVLTPRTIDNLWVGTDLRAGDRHTVAITASATRDEAREQGLEDGLNLPERAYVARVREELGRLAVTSVLGPRLINEFRLQVHHRRSTTEATLDAPAVIVLDAFSAGGNQDALFSRRGTVGVRMNNAITRAVGRSTLRFGGHVEMMSQQDNDRTGFGGTYLFGADVERDEAGQPVTRPDGATTLIDPLETYRRTLAGRPGYAPAQLSIVRGDPRVEFTQWWTGAFVQADWAPSPRFALSYGLRYELQAHVPVRGDLAPRVGVAWTPDAERRNTLRAGAGVFYHPIPSRVTYDAERLDGTRQQNLIVRGPGFFPDVPDDLPDAVAREIAVQTIAPDIVAPRSLLASVSYERRLTENVVASVGFSHERGDRLLRRRNVNAPIAGVKPFPDRGAILQYESTARSERRELVVALRTAWTQNAIIYGTYTFADSKSETDGPTTAPADGYTLANELGPSRRDARHLLTVGTTLRLPGRLFVTTNAVVRAGRPFNITTGRDDNDDTLFTDRPAFAEAGDPGAIVTPFGVFNPMPRPGDPLIPRNHGREPTEARVNLGVARTFRPGVGRTRLTLRGDVSNVLNRTNLTSFNGVLTSPAFGTANRALDPRRVDLSARVTF